MMARQAWAALETAHCLYTGEQVAAALDVLAARLEAAVGQLNPLIMVVLNGAVVFAGQLLPRLAFPLEVDYVHATRYAGALTGGALSWVAGPSQPVEGRTVVLLDDILDEGHTLAAAASKLRESGAARVLKAVLVTKDRPRGPGLEADFSALDVPDRYIFGWGMDYEGFLRNAKGIYVLP
ncbi:MAG: hypoxanthine-guanine phosphoribosyltransferase [Gammaproteobacteria bacterium]|nr:hypoxanthine-guanine phosphoribosyltransferase [Gammaproteobacteria bacterium]